jgi:pentatricopeptide repeat protein
MMAPRAQRKGQMGHASLPAHPGGSHMPAALPCNACPAAPPPAGLGQHWGRVLSILEDMQAAGVPWDAFTCSALLSACQASGRWEQALAWFRAAQDVPGVYQ